MPTLDDYRKDLMHQLQIPDDLDWDYFLEIAEMARDKANEDGVNMTINKLDEDV